LIKSKYRKAERTLSKHGICIEDAMTIFLDPISERRGLPAGVAYTAAIQVIGFKCRLAAHGR
jgi:uncharacterized DUF497 family protein